MRRVDETSEVKHVSMESEEKKFGEICGCDKLWTIGHIRVGLDYMKRRWDEKAGFINMMGQCKDEVLKDEDLYLDIVWDRCRLALMKDPVAMDVIMAHLGAFIGKHAKSWAYVYKRIPEDLYEKLEPTLDYKKELQDWIPDSEDAESDKWDDDDEEEGKCKEEEVSQSPSSDDSKCSIVKRLDFNRPMELKMEEIKKIQQENLKNMETMSCPSAIGGAASPVIPPGYKTPEQKKRKFEMPRLTRVKLIHDDDERGVPDIPEITYIETDPKKKLRVFVDVEEIGEEKTKEKFDTGDDEDVIYIKTVKNDKGKKPMICIDDVDEILSCHDEDEDYVPEDEDEDTEEDEEISYYTKICAGLGDDEWEDGDWTLDLGESYIEYNEMKKALMKDQTMTQKRYLQKSIASLAKHIKTLRREILAKRPPSALDQ